MGTGHPPMKYFVLMTLFAGAWVWLLFPGVEFAGLVAADGYDGFAFTYDHIGVGVAFHLASAFANLGWWMAFPPKPLQ